jgi:hypothetical protein
MLKTTFEAVFLIPLFFKIPTHHFGQINSPVQGKNLEVRKRTGFKGAFFVLANPGSRYTHTLGF